MAEANINKMGIKAEVWSEDLKTLIKYINEREQNLARYSNKLRQAVTAIVAAFSPQAINISLKIVDDEPFYKIEDEIYYLAIVDHKLRAGGTFPHRDYIVWDVSLERMSRAALKSLIKSGRLLPFLNKVAKTLTETEAEYAKVSETAEKIANAIKG